MVKHVDCIFTCLAFVSERSVIFVSDWRRVTNLFMFIVCLTTFLSSFIVLFVFTTTSTYLVMWNCMGEAVIEGDAKKFGEQHAKAWD